MAGHTSSFTDIEALVGGVRWRWGLVCVGTALLVVGRFLGLTELTPWLIVAFVATGGVTNLALIRLPQLNSYPRWLPYGFCLADVSLVSIAIVYLGPGATIVGFFLVVLPCASRPDRALALFALSTASVGLLIATSIHGLLSFGPEYGLFGLTWSTVLDLGLLLAVAGTVVVVQTNLFGRVAAIHSTIKHATQGFLEPQTLLDRNDLIGKLERSLNTMLREISSTIEMVQQEAEEVELIAALYAQSTRVTADSSRLIVSTVSGLAQELRALRDFSEAGRTESTEVAHEAENLRARAEREESGALALDESVQRGHDHVVKTNEAVLAISADVNRTMGIVNELGGLSRQIGSAALSIAKIARHTHVLALNAAIEAARAEEHGREFAVVAEQVRTLAGEAGRSARDVGNLIGEVQTGINAAESALLAGGEKLNDIGVIVGEARSALTELRAGASNTVDLVSTTLGKSHFQARVATSLASKMSQLSENSIRWSTAATEAADAMSDQVKQLHDLSSANQRLVELAKRLREQGEMFSTPR